MSADDQEPDGTLAPHPWPDLLKRPRREILIDRLLFSAGVTTLIGKPGTGKTTFAMAVAQTVAVEELFAGQRIKQRPVVWVPGEGLDDLRAMYEAWRILKGCTGEPQGFFLEDGLDFHYEEDTRKLIKLLEGKPPPLIVPDALSDMMGEGDEDRTKDMQKVYANFWKVVKATRASFLVPHHTGHEGRRERGSIVSRAKSDILIQVTEYNPREGFIKLMHHKRRFGTEIKDFRFEVKLVGVPGYKELIPVVTGIERIPASDILNEKFEENEAHGRALVLVMFEHFEEGTTYRELLRASGMSDSTFYRGLNYATKDKDWLIGGGGQGHRYRLNPSGSWKAAIMARTASTASTPASTTASTPDPLQGSGSGGSGLGTSKEAVWKRFGSGSGFDKSSPAEAGTDPVAKVSELLKKVEV